MKTKIGIVGTGDIAKQFAGQIAQEKYQVVSVYNHSEASLLKFVDSFNIKHKTTDYTEFLANPEVEIVYIGTPNSTHYDYALKALEKGKHVLCEKVMVMKGEEARHLFEVAKANQVVLLEAVTLFYMPMFEEVKKKIQSGVIGKVSGSSVLFGSCKEYDPENRFFSKEKGGGALFDIGTYAISAAVYFLGTSLNLVATDVEFAPTGVDEKSVSLFKTEAGEQASVMISFRGKMPKQVIITGDKGFVRIDDFPRAEVATIEFNDGTKEIVEKGIAKDVFTYELDMLNRYISGETGDLPEITAHVISLMDDLGQSWNQ